MKATFTALTSKDFLERAVNSSTTSNKKELSTLSYRNNSNMADSKDVQLGSKWWVSVIKAIAARAQIRHEARQEEARKFAEVNRNDVKEAKESRTGGRLRRRSSV